MATYDNIIAPKGSKLEIESTTEDRYMVGDLRWYISDEPDEEKLGIPVPAGVPFLLRGGRTYYAAADSYATILRSMSA